MQRPLPITMNSIESKSKTKEELEEMYKKKRKSGLIFIIVISLLTTALGYIFLVESPKIIEKIKKSYEKKIKEEKEVLYKTFNSGESLYCKNSNLRKREEIDNTNWEIKKDKFIHKYNKFFYEYYECKV